MAISVQQLFRAIQASDFEAAKRAFNLNPSLVHAKHPRDSHTPLHAAAALGNLQLLRDLLHQGASCQGLDCNNETPLHVASRQGHAAVVRELLTDAGRRSCVKSTNRDGATPLHLAVVAGHADVVQALVNAGARTDARDRAGRTPQDLVGPSQPALADILTQGRQLTPASAGRAMRRTGSPTLSPQPRRASSRASSGGMRSGPAQHQQQQQEPANVPQQMQQQAQPAAYHQTYQVEPQSAQLRSNEPVRPENGGPQPGHVKLHSPAAHHALPGGPFNAGAATPASSGAQGAFGMHYQQRQPQQPQAQQQPPSQLGPLRSARAAGPLAASAAAMAAVNDLARSFDYHPPTAHGMAPGGGAAAAAHTSSSLSAGGLRQQLSHGGIMAATGSYIVSPEASSGLLQGSAAAGSAPHTHPQQPGTTATTAAVQAAAHATTQQQEHAAAAAPAQPEAVGPLSAGASLIYGQPSRRSLSMVPGSSSMGPSTTANPGAAMGHSNALPPCPPNLAALAAAVSANSRVGPLSQPLQAQLNDLAAKVGQLEAWFEAQVELIPEWQKVLGVVQGIKRQLEEQQARQEEAEDALHSQQLTGLSLAAQVTALERARAADGEVLACVPQHTSELKEVRQEQASLKASLAEFGEQVRQLQAQMVHTASAEAARNAADECQMRSLAAALSANSARLATLEESQLAPLSSSMAANSSRVAALEAGLEELRGQLAAQQQQQQESNCEAADGGNAAPEERLAALEASLAELQLSMAHMHGTAVSEAGSELRASTSARAVASAAAAASAAAGKQSSGGIAVLEVQSELGELRARVADLSACLAGAGGGAVEEAFLPFMETTSNCLQQHEQQLDTIQALVPKLESVVAQRAQMCELMQQVAALQTAFNLLTGAKPTPSKEAARPNPSMLASGPMVSHKAAADYLAMATSMVKLQGQMGGLAAAVDTLQEEWGATEERLTTQQDAVKSAWEAERSRLAAAEREAVRRMADQQRELRVREERLTQIREAALAEEAARRSQLDSEARVDSALAGMSGQQQQLQGRLAGLADTTEALQEQLAALQAEVESSLVNLGPHISAMMAAQEASEQHQHASTAAAAARAPFPQEFSAMLSSLDATNPIHEPEPEETPQAPNPFAGDSSRGTSPRPAGPTQRISSGSIGWQQQQGDVHTSTALAYAEVTGGVCHVNLLPVPATAMRPADAPPAGTAAAPGMLPSSVSSAPPAAPVAAKKAGWFSRTLGSHGKAARHQHRYAAVPSQPQQADEDVALLDQVTALALSDTEQDVGGDAASPERRAKSGSRIADQALLRAGAGAGSSQGKHAGSSSSKWKKPWQKLGFGGKSSGGAAAGADVRPLRG
ncbi:hypothetical protein OEZ85_007411 [Tetradesmus obliquus]|uniref:Uncharacterized protein n=1 Tax=Tetradesmus obliquus TaxID=3088 RepID=A0ABY8TFW1_TETOB|nr:hypothetical protein OEZ85_007411 [Tetradesmus obliquus]